MSEIISKAMNSTLGTNKFKAFDELLLDSKSLIPGDDVVIPFADGEYWQIDDASVTKTETEIVKFTMPLSGTISLRHMLRTYDDNYASDMNVYVNGTSYIAKKSQTESWPDTPDALFISANRGDVITIKGKSSKAFTKDTVTTYNFKCRLYDIRYRVVDAPAPVMTKSV